MKKSMKYVLGGIAVLVVGGFAFSFSQSGPKETIQTEILKKQDLRRTVLATGTVTSSVDLALSFKSGGVVAKLPVKVGAQIKEGEVLAELQNKEQHAGVLQASGTVAQARANLQKVIDGTSSEEVKVQEAAVASARVTLDNALRNLGETRKQQEQAISNAYSTLLNGSLEAVPATHNSSNTTVKVSGVYDGGQPTSYIIRLYNIVRYDVLGPGGSSGSISPAVPLSLNNSGLFVEFSAAPTSSNDEWTVEIPNTKSASYITNLNSYTAAKRTGEVSISAAQNTVNSSQAALDQAIATLNAKKAAARPADIAVVQAQVTSAQGQLAAAEAALENTIIRAPTGGTITKVDVKLGELANAGEAVIVLQDVGNLYVEANISEANIANMALGQEVEYTLDALGTDRKFIGNITAIDPASTVVSGVVNYKVMASVGGVFEVRPGMTANMSVIVANKVGVLAVPLRAIVEKEDGKYVRILTDEKIQTYREQKVDTGLKADGGLIEILSGISESQKIVTSVEKK